MTPLSPPANCPADLRLLEFDFLRATEMAALNCLPWIGKGDKDAADAAACDAIRGMFDVMDIRGEIIIGEGIKDEAPGLFAGEKVGTWRCDAPRLDIAIDPLDGTTNLSKGLPNAISCIAVALRHDEDLPALQSVPAFYMKKLAYPPSVRRAWIEDSSLPLDINAPISEVIELTARLLHKNLRDVTVMITDRPRNEYLIEETRSLGASLRMITDGDIAAALAPALSISGVDLYAGIGGAPEGILAAAGLRCLGGGMQAQMWPRDDDERQSLIACGWSDRVEKVYRSRDLVQGDDVLFIATGISDSPLLKGVQTRGSTMLSHSVLLRQKSGSIRFVRTEHELSKRPLRLRSKISGPSKFVPGATFSHHARLHRKDSPQPRSFQTSPSTNAAALISSVLLFGAPGSGKGTIGKALGQLPGINHCSTGDIIRLAAKTASVNQEQWRTVATGGLIADKELWRLFDTYVESLDSASSNSTSKHLLLVDGIPRSKSQVSELARRVRVCGVFYLECSDPDVLLRRLRHRSKLESRCDDDDRVARDRLHLFEENTLPLLDSYPTEITHRVDASQSPERVLSDVLAKLCCTNLSKIDSRVGCPN